MNFNTKSKNLESGSDEVEEMLREAQDAMLLKLSVGSHMARLSSNLPPDLEIRFQGLKFGSSTNMKPEKSTPKVTSCDTPKVRDQYPVLSGNDDDDDLLARFAALKASLPQPSTATSSSLIIEHTKLENANQTSGLNSSSSSAAMEESSLVDESEVEKIIQWAIDAARLDPSPPSDDDNDVYNTSNDDNVSESGSSDEEDDKLKKGKRRVCK